MGYELRKVPPDWKHPTTVDGEDYIPLLGGNFKEDAVKWDKGLKQWKLGLVYSVIQGKWIPTEEAYDGWSPKKRSVKIYTECTGTRPKRAEYMPNWPKAKRTHLQMYENTTEGKPVSPVMETPEKLASWLAENMKSCLDQNITYDNWLNLINRSL